MLTPILEIVLLEIMSTSNKQNRTYGEILSELVQRGDAAELLDAEIDVEERKFVDISGTPYVSLTKVARQVLDLKVGDEVEVVTMVGEMRVRRVPVEGEEGEA